MVLKFKVQKVPYSTLVPVMCALSSSLCPYCFRPKLGHSQKRLHLCFVLNIRTVVSTFPSPNMSKPSPIDLLKVSKCPIGKCKPAEEIYGLVRICGSVRSVVLPVKGISKHARARYVDYVP